MKITTIYEFFVTGYSMGFYTDPDIFYESFNYSVDDESVTFREVPAIILENGTTLLLERAEAEPLDLSNDELIRYRALKKLTVKERAALKVPDSAYKGLTLRV